MKYNKKKINDNTNRRRQRESCIETWKQSRTTKIVLKCEPQNEKDVIWKKNDDNKGINKKKKKGSKENDSKVKAKNTWAKNRNVKN